MIKQKAFRLVEKGAHGSIINAYFDYAIMILIMLNLLAIVLETITDIHTSLRDFLRVFEVFSVVVFSFEYIIRIYVSDLTHPSSSRVKSAMKFVFSFYGLIDLLSITPFYLPFVIKIDLRFLRAMRLLRFIRILKINRYNSSLNLIWSVIKDKKPELAITGFVTFLVLLIASYLMYYIEGEAQPDKFPNVIASFWWAVATLTTVGYGDVYPITALGKFFSGLIAILGIGLVALPTALVSAGFMDKIKNSNKGSIKCPHCGKNID